MQAENTATESTYGGPMNFRHAYGERPEVYVIDHDYMPIVDLLYEIAERLEDEGVQLGYLLGFQSTCDEDGCTTTLTIG